MSSTPLPFLTIGRQILGGYLAMLLVLAVTVLIALSALDDLGDAKDRVIERDVAAVVDAHDVKGVIAEKAVAYRTRLLTGDDPVRELNEHARRFDDLIASLEARVITDTGRRLVAELRVAADEWDRAAEEVFGRRSDGSVEDLAGVAGEQQFEAYRAVQDVADQLIERQNQRITDSTAAADRAASRSRNLVLILGGTALAVAIGLATWITRRTNRRLSGLALAIDAAAGQIAGGTTEQVAGAAQQASAVQETVTTVEELVQSVAQSAERARSVADTAQNAADAGRLGTEAVGQSREGFLAVRDQVASIADTVVSLAARAQAISEIIATVEDIADQTHLLALNASIEAARAGESGRGFAVVAAEVRGLADQARAATGQITQILREIQDATNTAVIATEEGTKSVAEGVRRIEDAGDTIGALADSVATAALAAEQISASSTQQAVATTQIGDAMRNVDEVMEQHVAASRQIEEAAADLATVATKLKAFVGAA